MPVTEPCVGLRPGRWLGLLMGIWPSRLAEPRPSFLQNLDLSPVVLPRTVARITICHFGVRHDEGQS